MLLEKVNEEFEQITSGLEGAGFAQAPVLATPAALVSAAAGAAAAKAAGAVVGAAAVTGAAYAAYRAVAR